MKIKDKKWTDYLFEIKLISPVQSIEQGKRDESSMKKHRPRCAQCLNAHV
jgi:hypothetical protein